eukprot:351732-Chlamydomonas_euryale.AAC.9
MCSVSTSGRRRIESCLTAACGDRQDSHTQLPPAGSCSGCTNRARLRCSDGTFSSGGDGDGDGGGSSAAARAASASQAPFAASAAARSVDSPLLLARAVAAVSADAASGVCAGPAEADASPPAPLSTSMSLHLLPAVLGLSSLAAPSTDERPAPDEDPPPAASSLPVLARCGGCDDDGAGACGRRQRFFRYLQDAGGGRCVTQHTKQQRTLPAVYEP